MNGNASQRPPPVCPPDKLADLVSFTRADASGGLARLERLLADFPADPKLHFLRGSLLAASQRYADACEELAAALRLAPGYALARFQLGLLELTLGHPGPAEATWAPLDALPPLDPLRVFAVGLRHLIHDRFDDAVAQLNAGIRLNQENLPLNGDMQMLIDRIMAVGAGDPEEPVSATHLLLQRYSGTKQ